MVSVPLLSGIYATEQADFAEAYPVNLEPVLQDTGIGSNYLHSAWGAKTVASGPGVDRGGIVWNGVLYRVMGTKLVSVSQTGVITVLADVGGSGPVSMDYGFDRLAIRSGTNLYYWNGTNLTQVTDTDLGPCLDIVWMDGYYVSTDGTSIVVTDLSDPTSVNPLRYGSAEADPDMVTGLAKLRDELIVFGTNTIEFYSDVGGDGFPFQVSTGATVPIGCVGPQAKCLFSQTVAFCGSSRNKSLGIWLLNGSYALKLSTRTVDAMLAEVTDPTTIQLETRVALDEERLYVHLPDRTLVYLYKATLGDQSKRIWYICRSGLGMDKAYRPRNAVLAYNQWWVGDIESPALGVLTYDEASHFGEAVGWQFQTQFLSNQRNSFIVHSIELAGLPGRGSTNPSSVLMSYSLDGETWSIERANRLPKLGNRTKRIIFNPHKRARNYMLLRFRGDSAALANWADLSLDVEALAA